MEHNRKLAGKMLGEEAAISKSIVQNINKGDRTYEALLVKRYRDGLLFFLYHRSNDRDLAEDLVQDTFTIVIQRLRETVIESQDKLSNFIHAIAKNLLLNHVRKQHRHRTNSDTQQVESAFDPNPAFCDQLHTNTLGKLVRRILNDLAKDRDKEILTRFYLRGDEKDAICKTLALTPLQFDRVIFRARQRMKQAIEDYEQQNSTILR